MWKVTERDIDQIQIVLGMSLQEAMENYLGVTPIRSGDTVTIKNEISLEWTGSKKIDVW